jgi:hypothetical protein
MVESAAMLLGGGGLPDSIPLVPERMTASSWEGMLDDGEDNGEDETSLEDTMAVTTDAFFTANISDISGKTVAHAFAFAKALHSFLNLLTLLYMSLPLISNTPATLAAHSTSSCMKPCLHLPLFLSR